MLDRMMLGLHLRRWPNIKPALRRRAVLAKSRRMFFDSISCK